MNGYEIIYQIMLPEKSVVTFDDDQNQVILLNQKDLLMLRNDLTTCLTHLKNNKDDVDEN